MEIIKHRSPSPAINVALDEVLLSSVVRGARGPTARIWVNPPSLVIGYTLKPCEEIQCGEATRLRLPIIRRISGGGAVYHDYGNINISIAKPSEGLRHVDDLYREITGIVLRTLEILGVRGWVENNNDVVVRGYKVSGSAAAIKNKGYLAHATLLVSADLDTLRRVIKPRLDRVARGEVTMAKYNPGNLYDLVGIGLSEALEAIEKALEDLYGPLYMGEYIEEELEEAKKLARLRVLDLEALEDPSILSGGIA